MINIAGVEIPNRVDELTVEQFDKLNSINLNKSDSLDKWIEKFVYLGVPEEAFDSMTLDEFKSKVSEFNDIPEAPQERVFTFDVDGFTYETNESISLKDLSLIEKVWKVDRSEFSAECLAVLFKRADLTRNEHYTASHIKHKKALFKSLKCQIAIPHIIAVSELLVKSAERINDESTKDVE